MAPGRLIVRDLEKSRTSLHSKEKPACMNSLGGLFLPCLRRCLTAREARPVRTWPVCANTSEIELRSRGRGKAPHKRSGRSIKSYTKLTLQCAIHSIESTANKIRGVRSPFSVAAVPLRSFKSHGCLSDNAFTASPTNWCLLTRR